jgi:uncharacterized protein
MSESRKYSFSWELLGNIEKGRPNLGNNARLEVYRLMQYCFRDVIEKHLGTEQTDLIFYEAGKLAGEEFYSHLLTGISDFHEFISRVQELLKEFNIGIFRVEEADIENGKFILTVEEDLDCSGLPDLDYVVCTYDEGFIAGLLESFTGDSYSVREIDCWCTGDRTCRFQASVIKE